MKESSPRRKGIPTLAIALIAGCIVPYLASPTRAREETPDFAQSTGSGPESSPKTLFRWTVGKKDETEEEPEDSIVTDRPHFSEASSLVGKGHIQFESGYTFTHDASPVSALFGSPGGSQRVQTQSFPETLMRAGLFADWFEFRLAYNFLIEQTDAPGQPRTIFRGSDDLYIGAKLALAEQQGWMPEVAFFPQALLPTGDSHFTSEQVLPGFNLAYSWKINEFVELECNTQVNRRRDDSDHFYTEFIQTANVEYTFTKQFSGFTEWFCFIPNGAISSTALPQHYFHGGFVYLLTKDVQYDVHAAVGLNAPADDFFVGTGAFGSVLNSSRPVSVAPIKLRMSTRRRAPYN